MKVKVVTPRLLLPACLRKEHREKNLHKRSEVNTSVKFCFHKYFKQDQVKVQVCSGVRLLIIIK